MYSTSCRTLSTGVRESADSGVGPLTEIVLGLPWTSDLGGREWPGKPKNLDDPSAFLMPVAECRLYQGQGRDGCRVGAHDAGSKRNTDRTGYGFEPIALF